MHTPRRLFVRYPLLVIALLGSVGHSDPHQQLAWQADVQIKTLEVTKARSGISVRVVVYTEHDDEARDTRLLILLPVGAGLQKDGCWMHGVCGPVDDALAPRSLASSRLRRVPF